MTQKQQELYDKLLKKVNEYCLGAAAEDVIAAIDALVDTYETQNVVSEFLLEGIRYYFNSGQFTLKDIIQRLKALDIIKNKDVDFLDIRLFDNVKSYNKGKYSYRQLAREEHELLKEIIK